jgi:predicted ATPase
MHYLDKLHRPSSGQSSGSEFNRRHPSKWVRIQPALTPNEAELYRLKGEALLAGAGTASEAETAIEKGIDVARRQNAKSWELRGAMSLARLRQKQGRPQEAAALLAPIYGWFTEGFDTADLKEAKTLLATLIKPAIAAEK